MLEGTRVYRGVGLVAVATMTVTVAFVGLFALATGRVTDAGSRFPYYVVVLSVAFTALVLTLERYLADGRNILVTAVVTAITATVVVALDVEGLRYAAANPGELVASQLILYLFAAGCLCTGLVYWGIHHWREFVTTEESL